MAWYLTTKFQIKGYKREMNRIDEALSRQDVRGIGSPMARIRGGLGLGAIAGVLIMGAAFIMSILNPKPNNNLAEIVITRNSGRFVQFNGAYHPVTNLASARLIVGKPLEAKTISDAMLTSVPTGQLMGIPNAPDAMVPREDEVASWTVCDWHDTAVPLSLLKGGDITTTLIAGRDLLSGGDPLSDDRAVLVKPIDKPAELWLVYRDTRALIGRSDYAAQAALGLTPAAIDAALTTSTALLQAIPPSPVLTAPQLDNRGQLSPAVEGSSIGDILTTGTATGGRSYYLVGRTGVQMIGPVLSQMMVNTGSPQKLISDAGKVQSLPHVTVVDDTRFPSKVPTLVSDPALCWQWSKSRVELSAHTTVLTGSQIPVSDSGRRFTTKLLPNNGAQPQATHAVTSPGRGWYARITGSSGTSVEEGQIVWIDPAGTAFPIDAVVPENTNRMDISFDPTVKSLGLNFMLPTPIPWSIAQLYAPGATLSIKNAQVLQGQLEPVKQVPFPDRNAAANARNQKQFRPENAVDPNSVNPGEAGPAEPDDGDGGENESG